MQRVQADWREKGAGGMGWRGGGGGDSVKDAVTWTDGAASVFDLHASKNFWVHILETVSRPSPSCVKPTLELFQR